MTRGRKIIRTCLFALLAVFVLLVIWGLVGIAQKPRYELGDRTVSILDGATHVETFRLNDNRDTDGPKEGTNGDEIADYPLISQGQTLGPQFAARLSRAVQDPRIFIGPNDVTCEINPGVAFRAWHGRECVEVIVCYHCMQMLITAKDAQGHETHSAYTQFNWRRSEFLALAKEAFPGDKEIQSLH